MTRAYICWMIAYCAGCLSVLIPLVHAQDEAQGTAPRRIGTFVSNTGVGVMSGDYGTSEDTTIVSMYESLRYRLPKGEIGVTVPYLFRDGGGVTPGESDQTGTQGIPQDANGLGDVQLKGRWYGLDETESLPAVDWTARLKLPTASEDDGLGTGRVDVAVGTSLAKQFGGWVALADGDLVLRDTPSESSMHSVRFDYSIGAGHPLTDRWTPYLFLEGSTPSSSGNEAPVEVVLANVYKLDASVSVAGYILAGLTNGSPDVGAGTSLTVKF